VPSQPISTRVASRHRMAVNGFRCRFVASGIVSAYDRPGVQNLGAALALAGREPESTFSMIKAKFGDYLRSKTDAAMVNEVLCKFRSTVATVSQIQIWRRKRDWTPRDSIGNSLLDLKPQHPHKYPA
jgi:hypothetical protein